MQSQHTVDIWKYPFFVFIYLFIVQLFSSFFVRVFGMEYVSARVCVRVCVSFCLFVFPCVCLSACPSFCLSVSLFACLSVYDSLCFLTCRVSVCHSPLSIFFLISCVWCYTKWTRPDKTKSVCFHLLKGALDKFVYIFCVHIYVCACVY